MKHSILLLTLISLPVIFVAVFCAYCISQYDIPDKMEGRIMGYFIAPPATFLRAASHFLFCLGVNDIFVPYREATKWSVRIHSWFDHNLISSEVDFHETNYDGVPVRIYFHRQPDKHNVTGAVLFIHGGGFNIGSPAEYDPILTDIVIKTGQPVVAIDYRLAPSHPYPTPVDDCWRAMQYFLLHGYRALSPSINPSNILFMGDSAGGMAVLRLTLQLLQYNDAIQTTQAAPPTSASSSSIPLPMPKALIIAYPMTQFLTIDTPSFLANQWNFFLPRHVAAQVYLSYFQGHLATDDWESFIQNNYSSPTTRQEYAEIYKLPELIHSQSTNVKLTLAADPRLVDRFSHFYTNPLNSPLFTPTEYLSRFPNTFLLTCEFDILRDDGLMLARRMKSAFQIPTASSAAAVASSSKQTNSELFHHHVQTFHGILNFYRFNPTVGVVFQRIIDFINQQMNSV